MPTPTRSDIWTYFKPIEHNQDKTQCKICNKSYSRKDRTTSSLKSHLKAMHAKEIELFETTNQEKQSQIIRADARNFHYNVINNCFSAILSDY